MMETGPDVKRNLIPVVSKALDVLECFHSSQEELSLSEVTARTGVSHTMAFRTLSTLVDRQYLLRRGRRYRRSPGRRRIRTGFCATMELPLSAAIAESLGQAARQADIELTILDNLRSREAAMENAKTLAAEKVDVAIEFQRCQEFAPPIANVFRNARIPLIAVHVPHPGAVYFGPDNYRTGLLAGTALGQHMASNGGKPGLLVYLGIQEVGTPLRERFIGVIDGLRQVIPSFPDGKILYLDGGGDREKSRLVISEALRGIPRREKMLIAAASDYSALGALDAVDSLKLCRKCAVVGHDGSREALERVGDPENPFIGTVAFFPERYGPGLIALVDRLLKHEPVPTFNYITHELITKDHARRSLPDHTVASA